MNACQDQLNTVLLTPPDAAAAIAKYQYAAIRRATRRSQ